MMELHPPIKCEEEETVNEGTTVGLDLAKNVFHVVMLDAREQEVKRRKLRRGQVLEWFAQLPACRVGMEGCAGAQYWAREIEALGHEVRVVAAQHVKAYLRGNKHDYNDARAIAEAVNRPGIRTVAVKTQAQRDLQALHRLRAGCVAERTALANRLRGLLGEYGLVLPQGIGQLRRRLPALLDDAEHTLSPVLREALGQGYEHLVELDAHIERHEAQIRALSAEHEAFQRLLQIPGFGLLTASAFLATVGGGEAFRRGRDLSAALGLVPRQHSSAGKAKLLGISRRGDPYLRGLLIHAARAVVIRAPGKHDQLSRWINRLRAERGFNKAVVALANKLARIGWAVLRHREFYRPA